jgi:hypothetical protein
MLGHNTVRKHLHFRGHKGPVKNAYVHRASKGLNPLDILFYSILSFIHCLHIPSSSLLVVMFLLLLLVVLLTANGTAWYFF